MREDQSNVQERKLANPNAEETPEYGVITYSYRFIMRSLYKAPVIGKKMQAKLGLAEFRRKVRQ